MVETLLYVAGGVIGFMIGSGWMSAAFGRLNGWTPPARRRREDIYLSTEESLPDLGECGIFGVPPHDTWGTGPMGSLGGPLPYDPDPLSAVPGPFSPSRTHRIARWMRRRSEVRALARVRDCPICCRRDVVVVPRPMPSKSGRTSIPSTHRIWSSGTEFVLVPLLVIALTILVAYMIGDA